MHLLIVSLDAYSVIYTNTRFPFGGAEIRAWKFACGLSQQNNMKVSVMTLDQGGNEELIGNIKVYPHPARKGEGYWKSFRKPVNRFLRKTGLSKQNSENVPALLDRIKPDAVLMLGMSPETVSMQRYCRDKKIKFIFGCASDLDLDESFKKGARGKDISGNSIDSYWEIFEYSDVIIVQTPEQKNMLLQKFGKNGKLLLNPIDIDTNSEDRTEIKSVQLLWVGKSGPIKRPEKFIELAKLIPDISCRMIWNGADDNVGIPSNIEVIDFVAPDKMDRYFASSKLFVNTSGFEGFANTFLQSAKAGVPILSMNCDPNKMLSVHGAGIVTGNNLQELKNTITELLQNDKKYKDISENGRKYVLENHDEKKIIAELNSMLTEAFIPVQGNG